MPLRRIAAQSLGGCESAGALLLLGSSAAYGPCAEEHPAGLLVNPMLVTLFFREIFSVTPSSDVHPALQFDNAAIQLQWRLFRKNFQAFSFHTKIYALMNL